MCPLCATAASLTAATATATTAVIATWSLDLSQVIMARFEALVKWFLWSIGVQSGSKGAQDEE